MFDLLHPTPLNRLICCAALGLFAGGHVLAANPSSKKFDDGFAIHGKAYAAELAARAQALYEASNSATLEFAAAAKDNKVARLNWKPLGQNDVRLDQLRRIADQLEILGETAGIDYRMRADALFRTTGDIIDAWRSTPESQKQMDPVRLQLARSAPARDREIEKLKKMASEGKWEEAETALYRYLDLLGVATTCLFNPEKTPIYAPFAEVRSAIDQAMRKARTAKAKQLLTQRRQAEAPDFDSALQAAEAAVASLAASGTVSLDGAVITGPEAITKFGERWAELQVQAIRCRTLDWLLVSSTEVYSGATDVPRNSQIVAEYTKFNQAMMQEFARLIAADAQRVSGTEAVELYVKYLQACAPLIRRSANQNLAPVISPALEALAARAPQFPVEIAAYAEGTGDLLRWRSRVARSQAVARAAEFPSIDSLMFEATRSGNDYTGLYPEQNANPNIAALLASAPDIMPRAMKRLQGEPAHALDIVRLGNLGPMAVARYRVRSYTNIPAPLDLAAETDALKFDLMVDENLPPISMLAAVAVDSAQRCDLAAVGGTIANLYLESLTTRFAALPTAASVMSPLGAMPPETAEHVYLDQVLMRFDLTPSWAQHDFFFVEFPPPATPAE